MAFDSSDPTYRRLLDRILQTEGRVVPFVGAGLSVYGEKGERLPLWRELLDHLLAEGRRLNMVDCKVGEEIELALDEHNYIEATDRILEALGEPMFRSTVERELDDSGRPTPPAVSELVAIEWPLIVTTNLDRMISRAYLERYGRPMNTATNLDVRRMAEAIAGSLTSSETVLVQLHGGIGIHPSWKLTSKHYQQLMQDPGYVEALKHLFLRQVFFVGFGLQDGDFDYASQLIAEIYRAGVGEVYALVGSSRRSDAVIQQLITRNGLQPIYYEDDPDPDPADPFGGHRPVYECLAHLSASWAVARSGIDITLKYFPELDPYIIKREVDIEVITDLVLSGGVVQIVGLGGSGKTSLLQQFLADRRLEIATGGYTGVFGCSLYRADIGQFIHDLALATVGPAAESLPRRVEEICGHLRENRTLIALDGAEVALDQLGELRNPYVLKILDSALESGGAVILTSRIPAKGDLFERSRELEISPLNPAEIRDFLQRWGLDALDEKAKRRLGEITAGHPLALRILAGLLLDVPERDAIATIEASSVIDVADEVDPLKENRLTRVLDSYVRHMDDAEIAFLTCSSVFEGPASFPLVEATLTRSYPDTKVNRELVDRDLRPIVESLVKRRLLTVGTAAELSSHPTVREFFERRSLEEDASLVPLHRFLAAESMDAAKEHPITFEEAVPLIGAARHAAACRDWTLFDSLVRGRLMRGSIDYLCNNLGAWEEALELARLGDDPGFAAAGGSEPGYYPFTVARCLKHIGRSMESRGKYLDALRDAARTRNPDSARYVNNLLTLLIWRGEIVAADHLVELNLRALSWIDEPWKQQWQYEHGLSSIGYLRMLQGQRVEATTLFDHARRSWDQYPGERIWSYDYYPYYQSELVLLADPADHERALAGIEALLAVAKAERWPESVCRGHIQAAAVILDRSRRFRDLSELEEASRRLDHARLSATGMNVADVEIAHRLMELKVGLVRRGLEPGESHHPAALEDLVRHLEKLIEFSGLELANPELAAAKGILAHLSGRDREARRRYDQAIYECRRQGNALAPVSPRSLVHWLAELIGVTPSSGPPASPLGTTALIGEDLTPEWMLTRLDSLPGTGAIGLGARPRVVD